MDKILIGNLSSKGENILKAYAEAFLPSHEFVTLSKAGVRAKVATLGKRADTVLIIIDSVLYNECVDACPQVLNNPKTHKYETDEGLNQFLIEKFGKLEGIEAAEQGVSVGSFDDDTMEDFTVQTDDIDFGDIESMSASAFNETASTKSVPVASDEVAKLKEEIEQQKELIDRLTAGGDIEDSEAIKALQQGIKKLKADLEERDATISRMEQENYVALGQVTKAKSVLEEIKTLKAEQSTLKETISELTYMKTTLTNQNTKLNEEINDLKKDKETLSKQVSESETAKTSLDTLKVKFDAKEQELKKVQSIKETIEQSLSTEKSRNIELDAKVASLNEKQKAADGKIASLEADVERLNASLKIKDKRNKEMEVELTSVKESIADKDQTLTEMSNENSQYLKKYSECKADLDAANNEVSDLKKRVNELEVECTALNTEKSQFEGYKANAEAKISTYKDAITSKDEELEELQASLDDMRSANNATSQKAQEDYEACQVEIMELREINKELESRCVDYDDMTAEMQKVPGLKQEVVTLREQVKELQAKSVSLESSKVTNDSKIDASYRAKIAEMESDINVLQSTIDELSTGVYASLQNSALPKVKLKTKLDVGVGHLKKFYVFGSASTHSNNIAYDEIRKSLEKTKGSTLVIDLSTDSYIDSAFKPRGIVSPVDWLSGNKPIDEFISDTVYNNIKVVSIGLSFINSLYLLEIPWKERLEGLVDRVDNVVIYVGCITDLVSRILFQSFATRALSYLIVNATPVNLRTTILTLAGMSTIDNLTVCCVNLNQGSEVVYKKLASKYKTAVWTDEKHMSV